MQGPCPDGFFIPNNSWASSLRTMLNTILGRTATGNDLITYLKIPSAGYLGYSSGTHNSVGTYINVWQCSWYASGSYTNGYVFGATSPTNNVSSGTYNRRGTGYPIRPFKFDPVIPDSSWTTLYNASSVAPGAGIFHNASLGLITVYDGTDYITMADKNLGATTTDTSSTNSYGNFYQWGNNYGFPSSGFTTSSTRVDASIYGPGNYYYSSTFITTSNNNDWSTVVNDNLWGGVTQFLPCSELREAYIGGGSDYQEVEYIQSSGTQHIDTLHKHTADTKFEIKFNYQTQSGTWNMICGSRSSYNTSDCMNLYLHNSNYIAYGVGGKYNDNFYSSSVNTDYVISLSKTNITINGSSTSLSTSLTNYSYNDRIFGVNTNDSQVEQKVKMKLYYFKIYEGTTLVRDFIPCYRKSDNVIGMYDRVNNQFYTNSGSGTFTKGNNV